MGSTYTIKYVKKSGGPGVNDVQDAVETILAEVDRQMSTYRDDSDIERFNQLSQGCLAMPAEVLQLVTYGTELSELSDGAFDLTVEPLLDAWGFGPRGKGERIPSEAELQAVRQRYGHEHLRIEGSRLCKDAPVQVDFNSIAAGFAVDRVSERLQGMGVESYLVEVTGELKARGVKPDGSAWRIGIEAPRSDQRVAQKIIDLDGFGVSTSGDYRNYFERDGVRYSHTLDPRNAAPIRHNLAAVTVIDRQALRADGLSTLLMVLGPEQGYRLAEREHIAAFFVSHEGDGFISRSTPAFDALFPARGDRS